MIEPPYSQDAEESVLGAMLLSDQAIDVVSQSLTAGDFYKPAYGTIYQTMLDLRTSGIAIDAVTVVNAIEKRRGSLKDIGDPSLFIALQANVPSIGNARHYAKIVMDHALRRRMISEAQGLVDRAMDVTIDAEGVLSDHQAIMAGLGSSTIDGEPDDWSVEEFIAAHQQKDPLTKWVVHGLIRKQHKLMIVGGESDGKSVLMRHIAICAAHGIQPFRHTMGKPVRTLLVDLENPSDALTESFEMILKPVLKMAGQDDEAINRLWWRPAGIDLRNRVDVAHLENVIRKRRPELVCFGPMYCAFDTKNGEMWESPARAVQKVLKDLMVRYDFALILEDHAPQADSSGKRPMRPYGSSFWRRWLDIGIGMEPIGTTRTSFELNQWKSRVGTDWPKIIRRGDTVGSPWPWVCEWGDSD